MNNLETLDTVLSLEKTGRELLDHKKKGQVLEVERITGEKVIIDATVLKIWKGVERGVVTELVQEGLGNLVHDIYEDNK